MTRILLFALLTLAIVDFTHAEPKVSIDQEALEELRLAAEQANSDAVLILHDGEPIAEWHFDNERNPIELMSVLKSLVSIAVGRLVELGKIESIDQPVYTFYPEWNQGQKKDITIKHLLNHTSGLQNVSNTSVEIYPSPNAVGLALAAELTERPGSTVRYNNKATNLLSGIIEKAYGQPMDQFFTEELFRPLGIEEYQWHFDASGTPYAMAGLALHAHDLVKFGQLVLDQGTWQGEQLIDPIYLEQMLEQSQPHHPAYGLLWWRLTSSFFFEFDEARLAELEAAGIQQADLDQLRPLVGKTLSTMAERATALEATLGSDWQDVLDKRFAPAGLELVFRLKYGDIVAYYGDGYLGQTLMILPEQRIVAVRQVRGGPDYNQETDEFRNFKQLVLRLVED